MEHALFSISKAERWLNCPSSAVLEDGLPSSTSPAALEGIQAAEIIHKGLTIRKNKRIKPGSSAWICDVSKMPDSIDADMRKHICDYINWLGEILADCDDFYSEHRLSLIPNDVWGTADVIGVDVKNRIIKVIDFKYGVNVYVPAFNNPQIGIYGIAAGWELLPAGKSPTDFTIQGYIYQPRFGRFNEPERFDFDSYQMQSLLNAVKKAVYDAKVGVAPLRSGEWCQWCKYKPQCPQVMEETKELTTYASGNIKDAVTLTVDQLSYVWERKALIKSFLEKVDSRIIELASHGVSVPGVKVVNSMPHRKWEDENKVLTLFPELTETAVLSPAQAEKKLGKKEFASKCSELLKELVPTPKVVSEDSNGEPYDFGKALEVFK